MKLNLWLTMGMIWNCGNQFCALWRGANAHKEKARQFAGPLG
jgi:hypothetical protein